MDEEKVIDGERQNKSHCLAHWTGQKWCSAVWVNLHCQYNIWHGMNYNVTFMGLHMLGTCGRSHYFSGN